MTLTTATAVRAIVIAAGGLFLSAAAGWVPFPVALSVAALATLVVAGETLIVLRRPAVTPSFGSKRSAREALLDTSALIDGRLADVVKSGFLDLDLVVPGFVLEELQHVADARNR